MGEIPLILLPKGSKAIITAVRAGRNLMRRLMQMGLTIGSEVEVLENSRGPIVIKVREVTLAIGRGAASKVYVKPLT